MAEALDVLPLYKPESLVRISKRIRRKYLSKVGLVLISILILTDMTVNVGYHQSLERTGGVGLFSDAIYDLADYLTYTNISRPIAVDWGFGQLGVLTKGRVWPIEVFGYKDWSGSTDIPTFRKTIEECLRGTSNVYLFHSSEFTCFDRFSLFQEIARNMNKTLVLSRIFYQRDHVPVILAYKAK
jgi:hypothetical protein